MRFDRREVLAMGAVLPLASTAAAAAARAGGTALAGSWAEQPMRWFQLAFTEDDPGRYDPAFWLDYFKQIKADGICLSAGGGIAFYPTRVPWHGKAAGVSATCDPFGDMARACKAAGMRVMARIDPHAMNGAAAAAHPEWALVNVKGEVQRHPSAPDLTLTCAYGPYNFEFMPAVIAEIAARYPVDAFFGNRWNGSGTCYCASCRSAYRAHAGEDVPANPDPSKPEGRRYAAWLQQRLLMLIDLWNATIRKHRPDAFFIPGSDRRGLVDLDGAELSRRLPLAFGDRQARSVEDTVWSTGTEAWGAGRHAKGLRAFMGDKPVGQIISVGVEEAYRWKDSVQAPAEIRLWAAGTIAQGARPWITKFNAKPLDRRWLDVVRDLYTWHHRNERYLRNSANLAEVALVVSSRTAPYLGGWTKRLEIERHSRGFYQALLESRVPFDLIDDAFLDPASLRRFRTLVLANAAVLSDRQCDQLRAFVRDGGRLVATHQTSLFDETGRRRSDFGLADVFGCSVAGEPTGPLRNAYLSLSRYPLKSGRLDGASRIIGPVNRLPITARSAADVVLTLVPSYPDLPMERVFTDRTDSDIPMALCRSFGNGRVVYLPMDIDRTFAELAHGDHLALLHDLVDWAHDRPQPAAIEGPGLIDIACWRQQSSLAVHLVNLNNPMTMRGSYREAIEAGPYRLSVALPAGATVRGARLLEADRAVDISLDASRIHATIPSIRYHEVLAVDLA